MIVEFQTAVPLDKLLVKAKTALLLTLTEQNIGAVTHTLHRSQDCARRRWHGKRTCVGNRPSS